jgi:hypothetical protein
VGFAGNQEKDVGELQLVTGLELDACCRPLVGQQVTSVEKLDRSWFVKFGPAIAVSTEDIWRLISDGRIAITSEDHGHQFGLPEPVDAHSSLLLILRDRTVSTAAIAPSSGDLSIDFGDQTRLQLLQTSSGYESWRLSVRGSETICTGGGVVVRSSGG